MNIKNKIKEFHYLLNANSSEKKRQWWEKYLRNSIPFIGVGIPEIRILLKAWYTDNSIGTLSVNSHLNIAKKFIEKNFTEDKLTGILFIQLYLLKKENYKQIVLLIDELFDNKKIFDWNTCDWMCVRLLTPIIEDRDSDCIKIIASWKNSEFLWKARASAVSFAQVKQKSDYMKMIDDINKTLIKRDERFAKTSVGWLLREISRKDRNYVEKFVDDHIIYFTKETINNSMKYFEKELRKSYLAKLQ